MSSIDWEQKFHALVTELSDISDGFGIYPQSVQGYNDERDYTQRDGFKNGWNAALIEFQRKFGEIVTRASADEMDPDLRLLLDADVGWVVDGELSLNFNDTWGWATAWPEPVTKEELPEVGRLFRRWGWPGLLYWCSKKNEWMRSEFHDNNRFIDFVRKEEELIEAEPNSSKRAYQQIQYTLGDDDVDE